MYKVDDDIYRSKQPTSEEFIELEKQGFQEVLNLRMFNSDNKKAKNTSLILHHKRMMAETLCANDLLKALRVIKNRKGKILVHCHHGSDRTGAVIAMYRIIFQNWTKDEALNEMINGEYGFHTIYFNIPILINRINVKKFRKKLFDE